MVIVPAEVELIDTEQVPAVVVHVLMPPTNVAPPPVKLNVTSVPSGAGPKPEAPSPGAPAGSMSSCDTVAVIVCGERTSLVAVPGLILIFASGLTFVNVQVTASPAERLMEAVRVARSTVVPPFASTHTILARLQPVTPPVSVTVYVPFERPANC